MVFNTLVRGCLNAGQLERAAETARRAYEVRPALGVEAKLLAEVVARLGGAGNLQADKLLSLAAPRRGKAASAPLVATPAPWRKQGAVKNSGASSGGSTASGSEEASGESDSGNS